VRYATRAKVDAKTRLGGFLKAGPKNNGAATGGKKNGPRGSSAEPRDETPTLADADIGKKESAEARALAKLKARLRRRELELDIPGACRRAAEGGRR